MGGQTRSHRDRGVSIVSPRSAGHGQGRRLTSPTSKRRALALRGVMSTNVESRNELRHRVGVRQGVFNS